MKIDDVVIDLEPLAYPEITQTLAIGEYRFDLNLVEFYDAIEETKTYMSNITPEGKVIDSDSYYAEIFSRLKDKDKLILSVQRRRFEEDGENEETWNPVSSSGEDRETFNVYLKDNIRKIFSPMNIRNLHNMVVQLMVSVFKKK